MICRTTAAIFASLAMAAATNADQSHGLTTGTPELRSAGSLTFGPDGILFIGDSKAAAVIAVDTGDRTGDPDQASIEVENVKEKIASMLGARPNQIQINDMAVNPKSGSLYLSVSRGRGPDASPVVLKVDAEGKISEFALENVPHAKAALPNPPEDKVVGEGRRRQNNREFSITDLSFVDGRIIVAGLSNEEFASNLRAIPFPFKEVDGGAAVEIYHGAHGQYETRSPVRTFVPITVGGDPQIIAAYTCTPLVRIPVADLQPGKKVQGTTVAELGNRNRPLDIIAYEKDGANYLLMANSARGVMKITTDEITSREGITDRIAGTAGQPYETIEDLTDVTQLDKLNDYAAVILVEKEDGASHLKTISLP